MGLMKRCQRNVSFQSGQYAVIHPDGLTVIRTSMHDAMPDGDWIYVKLIPQPCACRRKRHRNIMNGFTLVDPVDEDGTIDGGRAQPRSASDPIELSLDLTLQTAVPFDREDLKLGAR
jgi:hypothetical protein